MDEQAPEPESPAPDFSDEDPAEMAAVAERIAYRNRRRILLGIALVVAFCIALSYLGPKTPTPAPTPAADKAGNIP